MHEKVHTILDDICNICLSYMILANRYMIIDHRYIYIYISLKSVRALIVYIHSPYKSMKDLKELEQQVCQLGFFT